MKAKIKETGEVVEVDYYMDTKRGKMFGEVTDSLRLCKPDMLFRKFYRDELEFLSFEDTEVVGYWERLKHQYAGMAMQGMVRTIGHDRMYPPEKIAIYAEACAHALVEKLKSESNGKQEDKEQQAESRHPFGDTSSGDETNEFDHIG